MSEHNLIEDIRGKGLIMRIGLVKDRIIKEKANDETKKVLAEALKRNLHIISVGDNIIEIATPLIISSRNEEKGLDILDEALSVIEGR